MTELKTLRTVVRICNTARHDIEHTLGAELPNPTYYAVLGRLDALTADVARFVADTLAEKHPGA
jgi:hypothetical protein